MYRTLSDSLVFSLFRYSLSHTHTHIQTPHEQSYPEFKFAQFTFMFFFLSKWKGDLGQTYDSNITLSHYESNMDAEAVLYVGDLSYADNYWDHDNRRWDSWGRFVERSTAYQPWIWTAGNHELDFAPELVSIYKYIFLWQFSCITYHTPNSPFFLKVSSWVA